MLKILNLFKALYNVGIGFILLFLLNTRNFFRNFSKPSVISLDPNEGNQPFPSTNTALIAPSGLLAYGGDISPARLINAYHSGIFPWYCPDKIIQWWSPDPRAVLYPDKTRISKSLRNTIRRFTVTFNKDFSGVVEACATVPRFYKDGWKEEKLKLAYKTLDRIRIKHKAPPYLNSSKTTITPEMILNYNRLHEMGSAQSIEIWNNDNELVGGLFGVSAGGVWCAESMFSKARDTSKIAFVTMSYHMKEWGFTIMDCQTLTPHLESLGAENISREEYIRILESTKSFKHTKWEFDETSDISHWKPALRRS